MILDTVIRDLLREVIRGEVQPLREDLRTALEDLAKARAANESHADLLSVEEVATATKVTEATVRTWIRSGSLRASRPSAGEKPGRVYRISRADLDHFLAGANLPAAAADGDVKAEAARIVALASHRRTP